MFNKLSYLIVHSLYDRGTKVDWLTFVDDSKHITDTDIITLTLLFGGNILSVNTVDVQ